MENEIISVVGNVGFPIAISIYLLTRLENRLEVLTNSINDLSKVINSLKNS